MRKICISKQNIQPLWNSNDLFGVIVFIFALNHVNVEA